MREEGRFIYLFRLEKIIFSRYLVDLHSLTHIDLSNNQIKELKNWKEKLGNVKVLILAGNMISYLDGYNIISILTRFSLFSGLSKLYSIEYLDVSNNHLRSPEVVYLS